MRRRVSSALSAQFIVRKNGLNIFGLLVAVSVLVYSLSVSTPSHYARSAQNMLASAATLSVAVAPNEYNTLAAQLSEKKVLLDEREAKVAAQESNLSRSNTSVSDMLSAASFFISIILLILVGLNFYLDARRGRRGIVVSKKYMVDMR